MNIELINLRSTGALSFIEAQRDIPFEIKRVYYIGSSPSDTHRGFHAHKTLKQLLFCPYGAVNIFLDNGVEQKTILLDKPDKGLLIFPVIWREMIWQTDSSILFVLASDWYDEEDYIRDYEEYLGYLRGSIK